ncbi:MAG: DNA replication protein [Rhodospirillaceae bacterium]|jgi:chromosomal replication initiation ATPase DnaA|nr:DNA replication protein [Rhodospirillaceae bacterium]MBT5191270.1 DNA replication protein [Rhodospirillaceae bacterium]MBT5896419.1 DNA replication protein [Rhodospirillaceae bacterium]MBT6426855.1 DNA replication protein [Rhodospirillaceae bacterium]
MNTADQLILELPLRTAQGRADFLVTGSNADAVAWLDRWPDWPGPAMCIHGPEGCGKSHLLQVWCAQTKAIAIVPAQLTTASVPNLAARGAIALDMADAVVDPEPLLHLYNLLAEHGGFLLLASRKPPIQWGLSLADLRSRVLAAPSVGILPPDDRLFMAVMAKMFADRQVRVGQDVLLFLAARIERSFAAAERAVTRLDHNSLSGQRAITVRSARALLAAN